MSNVNSVKYAMAAVAGFSLGSVISAQPGFTLSLESPSSALPVGWFGLPGTLDFNNDGCDDLPQISRFGEVSRDGGLWMDVDGDPELEYLHMGILQSADNPNCTDSRPVPTPDTFFSGENGIPYLLFYPYLSLGLFAFNPDGTPVPGQWPVLIGPSTAFATLSAGDIDGNGDDEIVVHTRQFF
ncbi:MAG: VCBS repeat-containing protein, partial [Pseudomonadota bacterium]